MRVIFLVEVQILSGVCPKLTVSLDEFIEKHPQRIK
jgi:hypothetical protein